jgi:hypothetical protein
MTMSDSKFTNGAIAFIDILGFKGIWNRRDPKGMIDILEAELKNVKSDYEERRNQSLQSIKTDTLEGALTVSMTKGITFHSSILSDTFVIGTKSNIPFIALTDVGFSISRLMLRLLQNDLFIRGAISYGPYYNNDDNTVFIGEAVDDVAQWFDKLNMIGVMATPKTHFLIESEGRPLMDMLKIPHLYRAYKAPLKNETLEINCLNWPAFALITEDNLRSRFSKQSAFGLDVFEKYKNTEDFFKWSKSLESEGKVNA